MRRDRLPVLGLAVLVTSLLTAGCGGSPVVGEAVAAENAVSTPSRAAARPSTRPSRPSRVAPPSASRPAGEVAPADLVGVWEGEYTCGQGNTGLKLTIKEPDGAALPTLFEFYPLPSNPNAAKGSYQMVGGLTGGKLKFRQEKWIDQPNGYVMVDLVVTSPLTSDVKLLSGDVDDPNCKGFSVRRP
ncbi:MAG TPA: hypothetical protein VFV67_24975 [Actinophytocola sp.]|uniref:hypothetical protein n=1 Tax=Actinophytocola sp. TaxID=1872138 RepID=UPI002DB58D45|nr:hypothetical protein [Actinophytocola sp.]HEU5473913.1 hypothetical protein [Actinophytocola sp.]